MNRLSPDTISVSFLREEVFLPCEIIFNVFYCPKWDPRDSTEVSMKSLRPLFSMGMFFKSHRDHLSLITANSSNRGACIFS